MAGHQPAAGPGRLCSGPNGPLCPIPAPGAATITREHVLIKRRIAGIDARVRVNVQSYRGVTLVAAHTEQGLRFRIELVHRDPELTVILHEAPDDETLIALWRRQAADLGLPLLVEGPDGRTFPMAPQLGPFPRRFGHALSRRRPRFLARRQTSPSGA
jgi:hypothetical protein